MATQGNTTSLWLLIKGNTILQYGYAGQHTSIWLRRVTVLQYGYAGFTAAVLQYGNAEFTAATLFFFYSFSFCRGLSYLSQILTLAKS